MNIHNFCFNSYLFLFLFAVGEERVLRLCQPKVSSAYPCTAAESRIQALAGKQKPYVVSCDLCDSDECNKGANLLSNSLLFAVTAAALISLKMFV